jgi:ABC-type Fe3+ transport system permease subunit
VLTKCPSLITAHLLKGLPMAASNVRRSVEELAQALYEASDPSGLPWLKRGLAVRDPWLQVARQQIAQSENPPERDQGDGR